LILQTKDLLKKVKKIEIKTKKLSNHIFGGQYHTSFKGRGMTFSEVRQYQYGDDFRAIDWNVSAKNNDAYIKVFEEEREMTLLLLVDLSKSQSFGTSRQNKLEVITEICATLAFSAHTNNDKIGLLFFTDQVELFIPPKKGKSHVLRIIRELIEFQPKSSKTNIDLALKFVSHIQKKKAIVFLISDFMDKNYHKTLQILSKKHDVTGIRIFDKREATLPQIGIIQTIDNEQNKTVWLDTDHHLVRENYQSNYHDQQKYCIDAFNLSGAGLVEIETQDSYVKKLLTYFKSRVK
jgi:uncharacterized protein (DUF58 family)